jgi:hypothetical protein
MNSRQHHIRGPEQAGDGLALVQLLLGFFSQATVFLVVSPGGLLQRAPFHSASAAFLGMVTAPHQGPAVHVGEAHAPGEAAQLPELLRPPVTRHRDVRQGGLGIPGRVSVGRGASYPLLNGG